MCVINMSPHGAIITSSPQIILLVALCLLVILVIYLATHHTRHSAQRSRWSLPSHFTIPILSPFTSVVRPLYPSAFLKLKPFDNTGSLLGGARNIGYRFENYYDAFCPCCWSRLSNIPAPNVARSKPLSGSAQEKPSPYNRSPCLLMARSSHHGAPYYAVTGLGW